MITKQGMFTSHCWATPIEVADGIVAVDYTEGHRFWGHDFSLIKVDGNIIQMTGHGMGVEKGDLIALGLGNGNNKLYRVRTISYYNDPQDMWNMTADWVSQKELQHLEDLKSGKLDDATLGEPAPTMSAELNNHLLSQGVR